MTLRELGVRLIGHRRDYAVAAADLEMGLRLGVKDDSAVAKANWAAKAETEIDRLIVERLKEDEVVFLNEVSALVVVNCETQIRAMAPASMRGDVVELEQLRSHLDDSANADLDLFDIENEYTDLLGVLACRLSDLVLDMGDGTARIGELPNNDWDCERVIPLRILEQGVGCSSCSTD